MSFHSRSSSEIETTTLRDVLPVFLADFMAEFSLYDVKDFVRYIFSEDEMRLLLADEASEKKQNLQLFWILYENEVYAEKFLKCIKQWYWWLSDKVFNERMCVSKETEKYLNAVRVLRSDLQKHSDFNVHRMEYYWPIRLALKKLKPFNYVVVSGEIGCGKKWIVVDVCSEYSIMQAMGLNIFWLDVRNCNSREEDFRSLQQFRLLIGEDDSTTTWHPSNELDGVENKILHLQQYIRDRLQHDKFKDSLLILSNVVNSKTLKTFNLGCKTLIITKNRQITNSLSESTTAHVSVDRGLTTAQCYQLFEKILQRKRKTFPKDASDIFLQSNGHPYLLSIIANNLKLDKKRNWVEWIKNLQNLQITDNKFTRVVELSLNVLQPKEMELYKTLAVFPHSIKIPSKLLAALWYKTERETMDMIAKFDKYSVINRQYLPDESLACVLPYVYSSYLKTIQDIDRQALHKSVISYYKIVEVLENRKDLDLFSFNNDYYFYHCIGYHLRESGQLELFPELFLDFGFLGEKLRSDGFANTIGDLNYFRTEITNNDSSKDKLVNELLKFLPSIEEMLFRSKDTCLLQYALMADGLVYEEAVKQATKFPDKVWFTEKGHFHQRRQIICLPHRPKLIKLPEPDTCAIALDNNDILLVDLSLDYNSVPVYLTDNQHQIIQMELILHGDYIITLDVQGNLKLWSIADDRRRSANRRRNSRKKVNPLNLIQSPEMMKRKCKQLIETKNRGAILAFHVETHFAGIIDLHLAFANGDICIYSWNSEQKQFELKMLPFLPTKVMKICYVSKILDKYYFVLSNSGKLHIYNLRDGSQTAHSFDWPQLQPLVYVGEYVKNLISYVVIVCRNKVLSLSFPQQKFEFLNGKLETVYSLNENDLGNAFTCARLSPDGCYLVLGTKRGLIVFNTDQKSEVLRGNISECITCVDIFPLDDNVFKYIVVCGSENSKVLNLFALRLLDNNTIVWSHRSSCIQETNKPQLEPDVWLQGNKLFDLNYSDSVLLFAVDSKNRIHQLCTTNTKNWSISLPPETPKKITAITAFNQMSYCAYENGEIFNITKEVFEPSFTTERITFLQLINESILVASAKAANKSIVRLKNAGVDEVIDQVFNIDVYKCFTIRESYLILMNPRGEFMVIGTANGLKLLNTFRDVPKLIVSDREGLLGGCDLKNNYLILATIHFKVFVYKINSNDDVLEIIPYTNYSNNNNFEETDEVTCLTSSSDASLFAVGLKTGTIEIYQMENKSIKFIYRLLSHTSQIYDLKFSPCNDVLVSCSEQLCFWHVSYILNNPFDSGTKQKRRSSRFTSSHSPVEEVTNAIAQLNPTENGETYTLRNPWSNKRGSMEKPELLSCIKFVGNKAEIFYANEDFTQFNTIDNEGVYYHLCVHDISRKINSNGVNNGNGNGNGLLEGDDEVII